MDIKALKWYRENSDFTENSRKVSRQPILYFDDQTIKGGRLRYTDVHPTPNGLKFFGTPGEYSALFGTSKYISVVSPPTKGKVFFANYIQNSSLTKRKIFPGTQQNGSNESKASPFHMIKLYFPGRASLMLDTNSNSQNYKNWN